MRLLQSFYEPLGSGFLEASVVGRTARWSESDPCRVVITGTPNWYQRDGLKRSHQAVSDLDRVPGSKKAASARVLEDSVELRPELIRSRPWFPRVKEWVGLSHERLLKGARETKNSQCSSWHWPRASGHAG